MRSLQFKGDTWSEYEKLRNKNKILHKKLCKIIKEMLRGNPAEGTGKPEELKHELAGKWSRQLNKSDRLIYMFDDENLSILAIGSHYGDH